MVRGKHLLTKLQLYFILFILFHLELDIYDAHEGGHESETQVSRQTIYATAVYNVYLEGSNPKVWTVVNGKYSEAKQTYFYNFIFNFCVVKYKVAF